MPTRTAASQIHFGSVTLSYVRFGSKADICSAKRHVRSYPKSGHVRCNSACPLCANSGHCSSTAESRHWLAATVDIGVPAKWWPMTRYKGAKAVSVTP